jgi:FkbM family methyltransferase
MKLKNLKNIIKHIFRFFGLSIGKFRIDKPIALTALKIEYVIDIGANTGQFAVAIRDKGYKGFIYSYEPLLEAHKKLLINSLSDSKWIIHPPAACGSKSGKSSINIAGNSASSSLKKMLPNHLFSAPRSQTIGEQDVEIVTVDSEINRWKAVPGAILLKIDTQGYEEEVLAGAALTLQIVEVVQIELSLVELYQGQKLYGYFLDFFAKRDFQLFDVIPGFFNSQTGQLLQLDAVFVKKSYLKKLILEKSLVELKFN